MRYLYILRYTCSGFELDCKPCINDSYNNGYIKYKLNDKGSTNLVRENKINRVHRFGNFTYVAYFFDKKYYPQLKAEMWNLVDDDIRKLEVELYHHKKQHKEFLSSKLGDKLNF